MTILSKTIYRFNAIPIKLPMAFFFTEPRKKFTIHRETQRPWIVKAILKKKNGVGEINIPDFRLYCKATVTKTDCYWHKNRNKDQWNKRESPEINPCTYRYLIFDKGGKTIQRRAKIASSTNGAGKAGQLHVKEWN